MDLKIGRIPSESLSVEPTYWDKRRITILNWLEKRAAPLAGIYKLVLFMLHESDSPERGLFIAHGVREIGNNLSLYLGKVYTGRVQYTQRLNIILPLWKKEGLPIGAISAPVQVSEEKNELPATGVSSAILEQMALLLEEHEKGQDRPRKKAEAIFEILNNELDTAKEILYPVAQQWLRVCDWFVGRSHLGQVLNGRVLDEKFSKQFLNFEDLLHMMAVDFVEIVEGLDEILAEANS